MGDFEDEFFNLNESNIHGKSTKIYQNGDYTISKEFCFQHYWSWDDFLCSATQRLEMTTKAQRVFNVNGTEINDIVHVEDDDMLFFSTGEDFLPPKNENENDNNNEMIEGNQNDITNKSVGGFIVSTFLGRGGFGEVRLGIHQITKEKVALKFILKSEMGSLGDVERTTIEIQCLTALSHENIIKLLRVMNEPEHMVLCVELLEGGDLLHYLQDENVKDLTEAQCRQIFHQVVAGVGYAHNQHICHRDLKLENLLLLKKNDISIIKIADFGLSDFYRPGAVMKTNCGSLSYLAPEVFRGTSNSGPPLDVWSLGVIFYALLTRKLPFEGIRLNEPNNIKENVLRNRILKCQYQIPQNITPEAKDFIEVMLCDDPMNRATIPEIFNHPFMRNQPLHTSDRYLMNEIKSKVDDKQTLKNNKIIVNKNTSTNMPPISKKPNVITAISSSTSTSISSTSPKLKKKILPTSPGIESKRSLLTDKRPSPRNPRSNSTSPKKRDSIRITNNSLKKSNINSSIIK